MKTKFSLFFTMLFILSICSYGQKNKEAMVNQNNKNINNETKKEPTDTVSSKSDNEGGNNEREFPDLFASPKTRKIVYDFRKGEYIKDLEKIRVHTPVVFEIRNINPFANRVVIKSIDSVIAVSNMSFDTESGFNAKEFSELIASLKETKNNLDNREGNNDGSNQGSKPETPPEKDDEIKEGIKQLRIDLEALNDQIKSFDNTKELLEQLIQESKDLKEIVVVNEELNESQIVALNRKLDTLNLVNSELKAKIKIIDDAIKDKKQKAVTILTKTDNEGANAEFYYEKFIDKYELFRIDVIEVYKMVYDAGQIFLIGERPNLFFDSVNLNGLRKHKNNLKINSENLNAFYKSYSELTDSYEKLVKRGFPEQAKSNEVSGLIKYSKYLKEKSDRIFTILSEGKIQENIKKAIWIAEILSDEENFRIQSGPIQPENDLLRFEVKIEMRDIKTLDKFENGKEFIYQQPTFGGTRVDFSLGLAGAYYWDVPEYYVSDEDKEGIENDGKNKILKNTKGMIYPSLIGAITMSKRSSRYITWGASAGMGLNVDNGKIELSNFFVGPSILFGRKDRIFLTIGGSLRNVKLLKNEEGVI